MELYEAIRGRRTAEAFAEAAPARAVITRLIDAALWAPNHRLTEPWRFVVIGGAERAAFGEALAAWLERGGNDTQPDPHDVRRAQGSMLSAPVTIVVAQAAAEDDDPVRDLEDYAACCAAVQNLMLAAHAEGLTTKWATGRLSRYAGANQLLGLQPRDRIVGYVQLGAAAGDADPPAPRRTPARIDWRGI